MAKDLVAEVPKAKEMFDRASEILGYDLLKVGLVGSFCSATGQSHSVENIMHLCIGRHLGKRTWLVYKRILTCIKFSRMCHRHQGSLHQCHSVPRQPQTGISSCCCAGLQLCVEGPKEKLDSTVISQPAIYVASLAAVEKLRATEGGQAAIDAIDVACGLSLGEYTALAFAGAIRCAVAMG